MNPCPKQVHGIRPSPNSKDFFSNALCTKIHNKLKPRFYWYGVQQLIKINISI
jgi:hypothetical protein